MNVAKQFNFCKCIDANKKRLMQTHQNQKKESVPGIAKMNDFS